MKAQSKQGLRRFQLKIMSYGNSYYIERIASLEAALARQPRTLQIDLIGEGEIPADLALLIRSILRQRSPKTRIVTNARSSLQGGSVLVWLTGDSLVIRSDAKVFFRRVDLPDDEDADQDKVWKEGDLKYSDSFSETDPDDADYARVLELINEYLPVKEMAGRPIRVPVLRQFGLVENEKLDHFLANAFGQPRESDEGSAVEPRAKRVRPKAKPTRAGQANK
ncbi:MAG TPA: hypothetical protein VNN22_19160 [Verrucomicrobiae bacterium]|nr:hypothetical protein [Verrucomicrobiae bacterium]